QRSQRSPIVCNISFPGADPEAMLVGLQDIAVSFGSACTAASAKPSYVLKAMGLSDDLARSSLRLSVGRFNTIEEIDRAIAVVVATISRLSDSDEAADANLWSDAEEADDLLAVA